MGTARHRASETLELSQTAQRFHFDQGQIPDTIIALASEIELDLIDTHE